jgi:hypothetical protein
MRSRTILILGLLAALPMAAHASWPLGGAPVCTATDDQMYPTSVSDGAGGMIVTWSDRRSGNLNIYVQRVNSAGASQWTADGVALCTATGDQWEPKIASDGAGGAVVSWYDYRGGSTADIYAQRVNASGVVLWTGNGVVLCAATGDQYNVAIAPDGAAGAIVAWQDTRAGTDIYAQRVDAAGAAQWTANGIAICTATNSQSLPMIAVDGAGGAIVTWEDVRAGNSDVYAQRVNNLGAAQWTANGVLLCSLSSGQLAPVIIADGAGGGIVAWRDGRNGSASDIFAQRVSSIGTAQWTPDGVAICIASGTQFAPTVVSDAAQGAIVTWQDMRSGTSDVYAQRVSNLGVVQWTANGVAICTATADQYFPTIASDGANGAIITWSDARSGVVSDIYVQRVSGAGTPQWAANGVVISNTTNDGISPTIVYDGAGGMIVAWQDYRSGSSDIYALSLNASGGIPTAVSGPTRGPAMLVGHVYPNPFAGTASMDVELATPAAVRIDVFDVTGRRVREMKLAGSQRVQFDGRDNAGRLLASGIYFCRVQSDRETITRKMVIAR